MNQSYWFPKPSKQNYNIPICAFGVLVGKGPCQHFRSAYIVCGMKGDTVTGSRQCLGDSAAEGMVGNDDQGAIKSAFGWRG